MKALLFVLLIGSANAADLKCMALNIYHESRGEPVSGQIAVAAVTLNRLKDSRFPDSICKVVYQKKQFSWVGTKHQQTDLMAMANAYAISAMYIRGLHKDPTNGSIFYHATYVNPGWKYKRTVRIGNHIFYKD